jgi:hypothetical protein
MVMLSQDAATEAISKSLQRAFPEGYEDSPVNRRLAMGCCKVCFPFIRLSFYDRSPSRDERDADLLSGGAWSFEEPPFVFPPPWHNANAVELERGALLLRDPSNAWRLPFWKAVFATKSMAILHLVRDVPESLQGLCDGWNYRYGFQTIPSEGPLRIPGYSDRCGERDGWKRHRLNFSVDRHLSERLLVDDTPLSLVEVCARQWRGAHEQILRDSEALGLGRATVYFSHLRREPLGGLAAICAALGLELSRSAEEYARSFSSRWVMATVETSGLSHERWRHSQHATEILRVAKRSEFVDLVRALGASRQLAAAEVQERVA